MNKEDLVIGGKYVPNTEQQLLPILTKREYFAALAMQGMAAYYGFNNASIDMYAVQLADLTLAELKRTEAK